MFIDEGFGSLDSDTLDMVMGTLDELRAGGRIVGLVSHVEELRQRIPSRLRIRRTAAGLRVGVLDQLIVKRAAVDVGGDLSRRKPETECSCW